MFTFFKTGGSDNSQSCDGIVRKVINLFERCLSISSNQDNVTIWRMFAKFVYDCGMNQKCESVIYRALQSCPTSKAIYLDAVHYLPHLLSHILAVITEKELRLRTTLEEVELLKQAKQNH